MYIEPFWCGVLATIGIELLIIIFAILIYLYYRLFSLNG